MLEQFAKDVREGLTKSPKSLSSKYFYDSIGSSLFTKIMQLPEYYLTDAEFEILNRQTAQLIASLDIHKNEYFELIELGAGDGFKTIELLKFLGHGNYQYDYVPIDISSNSLDLLEATLKKQLGKINIRKKHGDYFQVLHKLQKSTYPKVVMFLGSNMGNMTDENANEFLKNLSENLSPNDKLILGVDLMKSREIVLPAYNDSQGVTRDFNLNLLSRINRELGADFAIEQFEHLADYDEEKGVARSWIVSKIEQEVEISAIGMKIHFQKGEKIATEISRKYNDAIINRICMNTGLEITHKLTDSRNYFADYILKKK